MPHGDSPGAHVGVDVRDELTRDRAAVIGNVIVFGMSGTGGTEQAGEDAASHIAGPGQCTTSSDSGIRLMIMPPSIGGGR